MSFVTVELSINLGGSKGQGNHAKCKTGGSLICSADTRGCNVQMREADIEARTCIGTSFKPGAIKAGASDSEATPELVALRTALEEILANHPEK